MHSFLHSLLKFYSKQKFVWFCYLVVFISTLLFCYLFYLVLLLKITLFNTVYCDGKNLTRLWSRCYDTSGEKLELTPLFERISGLKLVDIEPLSIHQKRGLSWITNWQFYWSRTYVRLSLKIPSQYETYTWGYTWRRLACYHSLK